MAATPGVIFAGKPTQVETGTHNGARNKPNEDRFDAFVGPGSNGQPAQFLVVADGVTSTHGGERASDIAVRVLRRLLQSPPTSNRAPKPLRDRLADAIHAANQEILETARKDPDLKGMSTTLVVAAIDGDQLLLMHLGDSRAYLIRGGKAYQLTRDHSWVQDALDEGRITPEQARTHPNKHVIQRYLGDQRGISIDHGILDPGRPLENPDQTEMVGPIVRQGDASMTLRSGDALLLCSDGLYNRISDEEIAAAATKYAPEKAVKSLIEQAVKRDEPDNITIVFWPTGGAPVAAAAAASRRPTTAIALAAAGIVLALAAVWFIFGQSGGQQAGAPAGGEPAAAAPLTPTTVVAAAQLLPATAATTPVAIELAAATTPPDPTAAETAPTTSPVAAEPTSTPAPTSTPDATPVPVVAAPTSTAVNGDVGASQPETPTVTATAASADAALAAAATKLSESIDAPSSTPAQPERRATSTPAATATPAPTSTNTTTPTRRPTAAASASPTAATPASTPALRGEGPTSARILSPSDNAASAQPIQFAWEADRPLAQGQEFEVIFWRTNEDVSDINAGHGWVRSNTTNSIVIDPEKAPATDTYRWAVVLVGTEPTYADYVRLSRLSEVRTFTASSSGGGGGRGSSGGEGSGKP